LILPLAWIILLAKKVGGYVMIRLNRRRIGSLIAIVVSVIMMVISQTPAKDLVSTNMTVKHIEEATNLPLLVLIGIAVLLVSIFVYLWIDTGKDEDIVELTKI
jgi:fucose 4-O-acetylase-like acetyltransferase